jgi:hypothetical protein
MDRCLKMVKKKEKMLKINPHNLILNVCNDYMFIILKDYKRGGINLITLGI